MTTQQMGEVDSEMRGLVKVLESRYPYPEWVESAARRIGGDTGLVKIIIWDAYQKENRR